MRCDTMNEKERLDALKLSADATFLDAMRTIETGGHEIAFVCGADDCVIGTLTDGDIRRALLAGAGLQDRRIRDAMQRSFVAVPPEIGRAEVLDLMRARSIRQIPVLDETGRLCGVHLLQELIGARIRPNRAVIMAGGKGTRLQPITHHLPKPLVRVAGRPILERILLHLVGHGIRHIYISVNYLGKMIEDHFGDGSAFGCHIDYLRESEPLGTAGALSLLPGPPTHPIVVMNGDLLTHVDLGRMLEFHTRRGFAATVGVRSHTIDIPYGVAVVEDGELVEMREKPSERVLVNTGVYVLSADAVRLVPPGVDYPMTALLGDCGTRGFRVGAHLIEDEWADVGRHEDLHRARGGD